jgi:hypothetical protein
MVVGVGASLVFPLLMFAEGWRVPCLPAIAVASVILLTGWASGLDLGPGLVVPQFVARRGPNWSVITFGLFMGAGLSKQERGLWLALMVASLGAHGLLGAVVGPALYAVVRCSAPLAAITATSVRAVIVRLTTIETVLGAAGVRKAASFSLTLTAIVLMLGQQA